MRSLVFSAALLLFLVLAPPAAAQDSVQVEALMPGMAVLTIDGRRHTLREGDREAGVRLVSANGSEAVLEIRGERRRAGVSDRIAGAYTAPEKRSVTVARDERMQYRTSAAINGRRMEVLIDTGANVVALSRQHAAALGINAEDGQPTRVETAGSTVAGFFVTLDSVDVGGIRVDKVRATVVDGDFPRTVLLGMSYLRHVQLSEQNGVLSLTSPW
jgi:aspartyl protease family protein